MGILKKLNVFRGAVLRKLTNPIGISHVERIDFTPGTTIKKILIIRPNHRLGNLLLITPLLQEIMETLPQTKIDLFVKGNLAPALFRNYPNIHLITQLPSLPFKNILNYLKGWIALRKNHYDIVINVVNQSASGRLSTKFANSTYRFFGDITEETQQKFSDHRHLAKYPVYSFRDYLRKMGFRDNPKPVANLDLKLSTHELDEGKKQLHQLTGNENKTICLFTYATADKCYSTTWWGEFYEKIKMLHPGYNIVEVLPVENISQIERKAPTYSNKDVRAVGAFIANTHVFICADGGVMHLGSAALTPTIGLFKVTNAFSYEPYNKNSAAIDTTKSTIDDCLKVLGNILAQLSE